MFRNDDESLSALPHTNDTTFLRSARAEPLTPYAATVPGETAMYGIYHCRSFGAELAICAILLPISHLSTCDMEELSRTRVAAAAAVDDPRPHPLSDGLYLMQLWTVTREQ
jgi:hypothetical protein